MIEGQTAIHAHDARPVLSRFAITLLALGLLSISACSKPGEKKEVEGPKAPSAAQVARDAVEDFEAPQPGQSAPNVKASFDGPFTAGGMEPFWSARIAGGKLTIERPDTEAVSVTIGALKPKDGVAKVKKGKLTMILSAQSCVDPSGTQLDYRMLLIDDGDAYEGCARLGDAPANRDWSAFIEDYLPAIDGCIAKARSKNLEPQVTLAYPRTHGHTGVRLSTGPEGRFECDADTKTGVVKFFDPLGEDDVLPGEWSPLFTRLPGAAPEGQCNRNLEAKSARGEKLGWFTYESC